MQSGRGFHLLAQKIFCLFYQTVKFDYQKILLKCAHNFCMGGLGMCSCCLCVNSALRWYERGKFQFSIFVICGDSFDAFIARIVFLCIVISSFIGQQALTVFPMKTGQQTLNCSTDYS